MSELKIEYDLRIHLSMGVDEHRKEHMFEKELEIIQINEYNDM